MPFARIDLIKGKPSDYRAKVADIVYEGIVGVLKAPDGEWGLNYLCAGYKRFFHHVDSYMKTMTQLLQARRPPAEIMEMLARSETRPAGRNDPCPCGSGKKFKRCCLGVSAAAI